MKGVYLASSGLEIREEGKRNALGESSGIDMRHVEKYINIFIHTDFLNVSYTVFCFVNFIVFYL